MDILLKNHDISQLSNFHTPATAQYYFEISSLEDISKLTEIYNFSEKNNLPVLIVWWGTNLLFAFDNYKWIVIQNSLKWWSYHQETSKLEAYSSESIWDIAQILESDDGQDLWHRFIGLPGSIGWAVFWNAGCFWLETENNFVSAKVWNIETQSIEILSKEDMEFTYRSSILKTSGKYFLISVIFDLSEKIEKYHSDVDNLDFRENKQPKWNTCGSFFKNPSKEYSAGRLIEEVGLKWFHHWWAFFSELHANFLMFDGKWSYTDLLELIEIAQEKVKKQFDIEITPEVRIIHN